MGGNSLYLLDKPSECATCAYSRIGTGFCPDWSPPSPKIAVLCEAAGSNEIIDREPLVGAAGWVFTRNFLFALGYTRSDVMLCNTLRCHPPDNSYPTGDLRRNAERSCRIYDNRAGKTMQDKGLNDFNPDTYLITIHPSAVNRTWSLLRVVQNDMAKAFRLADQGRKVLVLMGDKAMNLVVPHIPSVSKWRGHYGSLNWADFRGRW